MVTQLYDTSMEICEVAVMYLEEVCTEAEGLEKVVQLRPALEHLGDVGHPLFMRWVNLSLVRRNPIDLCRFVSTSIGFDYLHHAQYIERELDLWLSVGHMGFSLLRSGLLADGYRRRTTST
jgi:rapamycin-insensitive companion of mTOR